LDHEFILLRYDLEFIVLVFIVRGNVKSQSRLIAAGALILILAVPKLAFSEQFIARVFGVHDGDSLRVNTDGGRTMRVRLYGVDCPEIKQPYGIKARALTRQLAFGRLLTFESKGKDRYGRIIARVYLLTRKMLAQELVKAGACWWYQKYAPDDEGLKRLEREAKAEMRGLWAEEEPVPPWKWRRQKKK
jgi:endonuclease YncB( thermonuclease family)